MADIRIKDLTTASLPSADDHLELDGITNGSRKLAMANLLAGRGSFEQSGGVIFRKVNGSYGSRDVGVARTITIYVKPCFSIKAQVPRQNITASRGIFGWSDTAGDCLRAGALALWLDSSGYLVARLHGATSSDWRQLRTQFVGIYPADSEPLIHWDLRAGKLYIDTVDTAALETVSGAGTTPPAWTDAVTGTVLTLAAVSVTTPWQGKLSKFARWNFQATAPDRLTSWMLGGDIPPHRMWGRVNSNTGNIGNVFGYGANDGSSVPTLTFGSGGQSAVAGARDGGAGAYFLRMTGHGAEYSGQAAIGSFTLMPGAQLEFAFWARKSGNPSDLTILITTGPGFSTISGGNITPAVGGGPWAGVNFNSQITTSWSRLSQVFTVNGPNSYSLSFYMHIAMYGSSGPIWDIDDLECIFLGVDLFLPMEEGIGYQFHDVSGDRLDVSANPNFSPAPYFHALPKKNGYVRNTVTWSGSAEDRSLLGHAAFPSGAVTTLATLHSTGAATTGPTVGTTNNASWVTSSVPYSAGQKKVISPVNVIAAANTLADRDRRIVPNGGSNYTGTITYEEHYTVTEGAP